ncbi:MAG: hypothetical protein WED01_04945 [Candidatus Rokuibacteriota bacterium]
MGERHVRFAARGEGEGLARAHRDRLEGVAGLPLEQRHEDVEEPGILRARGAGEDDRVRDARRRHAARGEREAGDEDGEDGHDP